jgi:hypothetical protein
MTLIVEECVFNVMVIINREEVIILKSQFLGSSVPIGGTGYDWKKQSL